MRKVALLAMIISIWVMLIHAADDTWDLTNNDANKYSDFLVYVRGQVRGTTCFRIPIIRQPPTSPPYVLVNLKSSEGKTIRLALSKKDLYVVGYSDTFNNKARAFYFKRADRNAFPGAAVINDLWYTGSYQDLDANAKISRKSLGLSKTIVNRLLNNIHGKAIDTDRLIKDQARFLLVVVQMVAEAVRFRYIEAEVEEHYTESFLTPNEKVLSIVGEWDKITTAIVNAKQDGTFQSPLTLKDPDGKPYNVSKVDDVRNDIATLKYVSKQCARTASLQIMLAQA